MFTLDLNIRDILKKTAEAACRQLKILIVDDNADFADMFTMILNHLGCTAVQAYSGHAGLSMAQAENPDIIFCDIGLPDMTGIDVAKYLRIHEERNDALMVAMSGSFRLNNMDDIDAYFDFFTSKPIRTSIISEILTMAEAKLLWSHHIPDRYVSACYALTS